MSRPGPGEPGRGGAGPPRRLVTEAEMVIAAAVLIGPPTKPRAAASLQGRPVSSIQARRVRVRDPTLNSRLGPGPRSPTRLPGLEAATALQYVNVRNNWLQVDQEEEPPKEIFTW